MTVLSGSVATSCTDPADAPDPLWRINVNNRGWVTYPRQGTCFTALPNLQYRQTYDCPADLPTRLEICLEVFENDGDPATCSEQRSCAASICRTFIIPQAGSQRNYTIAIPTGQSSSGEVEVIVETKGSYRGNGNDRICNAIDLGTLNYGGSVGRGDTSIFNNYCGAAIDAPKSPGAGTMWVNNVGILFSFTTGPGISKKINILGVSDPSNIGDPVELQLAVYSSTNNSCSSSSLVLVAQNFSQASYDESIGFACDLRPNTKYYVQVDGSVDSYDELYGYFGLEIRDVGATESADLPCDAVDLGAVPDAGILLSNGWYSNYCANNRNEPAPAAFSAQHPVWFQFTAPASGHIQVASLSDTLGLDLIDVQMALFESPPGTCDPATWTEMAGGNNQTGVAEAFETDCLEGGRTYYLLVDNLGNQRGIFQLVIRDAGPKPTPYLLIDTMLCAGESLQVGTKTYAVSGTYIDTIPLRGHCDSIVETRLQILDPLQVEVVQIRPGVGTGQANGALEARVQGGAAPYRFTWPGGQTTATANGLVGGQNYCVTVTDANNCEMQACFDLELVQPLQVQSWTDSVRCNGDRNGVLYLVVQNDRPPYVFTYRLPGETSNRTLTLPILQDTIKLPNLPAGTAQVAIAGQFTDTTLTLHIGEPAPFVVSKSVSRDATCFGYCDGSMEVSLRGGNGGYQYNWSNNLPSQAIQQNLCAGSYYLDVRDQKGCRDTLSVKISQPDEFIANIIATRPIACFGGSDGQIEVQTNGIPRRYAWSTGDATAIVDSLATGNYTVTVTNQDNCRDTATYRLLQPNQAVLLEIVRRSAIICNGEATGALLGKVSGPGNLFTYAWNNGVANAENNNLTAGNYSLTVTNENGCTDRDSFELQEPSELNLTLATEDYNCYTEEERGSIFIENTNGGQAPYAFSLEGRFFRPTDAFTGLEEGSYEVYVRDGLGCVRRFPAFIQGPPELMAEISYDEKMPAGVPVRLILGDTITLFGNANSNHALLEWNLPDSVACEGCDRILWIPQNSEVVRLNVMDTLTGCRASTTLAIEVGQSPPFFVPTAFSPNGDGANDYFTIYGGSGVRSVKNLRIFSRSGELIYFSGQVFPGPEDSGWDGSLGGRRLSPQVFIYLAEIEYINGKVEAISGDVVLMR